MMNHDLVTQYRLRSFCLTFGCLADTLQKGLRIPPGCPYSITMSMSPMSIPSSSVLVATHIALELS